MIIAQQADRRIELIFRPGRVALGHFDNARLRATGWSPREVDRWITMGRDEINLLIRELRLARDEAYGPDE